jgi:hypothetical protein
VPVPESGQNCLEVFYVSRVSIRIAVPVTVEVHEILRAVERLYIVRPAVSGAKRAIRGSESRDFSQRFWRTVSGIVWRAADRRFKGFVQDKPFLVFDGGEDREDALRKSLFRMMALMRVSVRSPRSALVRISATALK